jgi:hypothetical protein
MYKALAGRVVKPAATSRSRLFGLQGIAGNATDGYNYGIYGALGGSQGGAGVFGIDTDDRDGLNIGGTMRAGWFEGNLAYTGGLTNASDRRLKRDIKPLDSSLEKLMQLPVYTYFYKDKWQNEKRSFQKDMQYGFIAQEVMDLYPTLVDVPKDTSNFFYMLEETKFIPLLVKGMQEQQAQIEQLESENEALTAELEASRAAREDYEARLERLEEAMNMRAER